jgi:F-type H+-transporting ATPase subunit delta
MATVGNVYAKAIFELGTEKKELDGVLKQLQGFWAAVKEHSSLVEALTGPVVDARTRQAILADVSKTLVISGLASRLLEMLAARGRLGQLPSVLHELEGMIEASQGVLTGKVTSAVELSSDELDVLGAAISKRVGSRVKLKPEVDASLLGGVVATVAGRTFDASLRTQLERFKNQNL